MKSTSNDSIVISFEGVAFYYNTGSVEVQATLSANGVVTVCYGEGEVNGRRLEENKEKRKRKKHGEDIEPDYYYEDYDYDYDTRFAAGIEGGENDPLFPNGPAVAYPLIGPYFDSNGIADEWPTNECYCFNPDTHEWEQGTV